MQKAAWKQVTSKKVLESWILRNAKTQKTFLAKKFKNAEKFLALPLLKIPPAALYAHVTSLTTWKKHHLVFIPLPPFLLFHFRLWLMIILHFCVVFIDVSILDEMHRNIHDRVSDREFERFVTTVQAHKKQEPPPKRQRTEGQPMERVDCIYLLSTSKLLRAIQSIT